LTIWSNLNFCAVIKEQFCKLYFIFSELSIDFYNNPCYLNSPLR